MEREIAATAPGLGCGCYYGGNPIGPQLKELRRGVDIVVGTPGRIIDLIDQDALDLSMVSEHRIESGCHGGSVWGVAEL